MKRVRLHTWWCPPLGLILLWREPQVPFSRKISGTVFIALYSLVYAAGVIAVLMLFFGLQYEFRGGLIPYLTFRKTLPDYDKLEASRRAQKEAAVTNTTSASYWNGFRGPNRDGHYTLIHTNWAARLPRLLWKQPVGGGYASFACGEGRAYTIEQRRDEEAAVAYDIATGRELWAHRWPGEFQEPLGGDGPRATPAYDNGRIYVLGAMGEFRCLQAASGQLLWRKNILAENDADNLTYGVSASPFVLENRVITVPGGPSGKSVVAYDKHSGEAIWKSLDEPAAYSSPMLFGDALLLVGKTRAMGVDAAAGKLLWEFPWVVLQGNRNIAQPVILSSNRFFLSAGYGTGCAAVEISRSGNSFSARELWRNKQLKNKFTSSVFHEGFIYGLDEDILVCLDASNGQRRWKDGRYGYGQLLLATGHLVILCGDGDLALVRASPDAHHEVARFAAIEGKTWNHPAIENGRLLVRNGYEMACFDLRP